MKQVILRFSAALLLIALYVFNPSSAAAWSGQQGWVYDAGYPISSSVAVAGGLVIAGDNAGYLHAVHIASGQAAWIYEGFYKIVGLPAVYGGSVIFVQADGTVTALSLADGKELWKHKPPSDGAAGTMMDGAAAGDGKVFFSKGDGKLLALSASNGSPLWTYGGEMELRSAPCVSGGLVFAGEYRGILDAIDPNTGKRLWGGGAGGAINTPAVYGDNVYFSSWDGSVKSVRIKGVIPQWSVNVGDPVTTSPFIDRDKVFVGTAAGKVTALSQATGANLWSFDTQGGNVAGTTIAAEGLVFAAGGQGTLFVLDAASGALRFTFGTGDVINGTPAYSGGILFLGSNDGKIYAIR